MISRRTALLLPVVAACSRRAEAPPAGIGVTRLRFERAAERGGPSRATVLAPTAGGPFPVLVALPGRGEVVRGPEAAAEGWLVDYHLDRAIAAATRGLRREDFAGHVGDARLRELASRPPLRGLVVVCPDIGDVLAGERRLDACDAWARALVDDVLPEVRRRFATTGATGIDGVSLGGRAALLAGLAHPEAFTAVGSLQAAIRAPEVPELVERARRWADARRGGALRLLTSDGDYFRPVIGDLARALGAASVAHEHVVVAGPHDYSFNRGPGGIEMLMFHDEALRRGE